MDLEQVIGSCLEGETIEEVWLRGGWCKSSLGTYRYYPKGSTKFVQFTFRFNIRHDNFLIKGQDLLDYQNFHGGALSDYFLNPNKPTQDERVLFDLEFGIGYPTEHEIKSMIHHYKTRD